MARRCEKINWKEFVPSIIMCVLFWVAILGTLNFFANRTQSDVIEKYDIKKIQLGWVFDVYVEPNWTQYRMAVGTKTEVKTDLLDDQKPFLEVKRLAWWQNEYTVHVHKKRVIVKVMMHEAGRYTVFFEEGDKLVPEEIDAVAIISDVPEGEPMYLEASVSDKYKNHQSLSYAIHIHKVGELEGGMWRQRRGKAPDRTGQTIVIE